MPTWSEILNDIKQNRKNIDDVRRGFIKSLSEYTGRNTIIYYSAFLTKQHQNVDINDTTWMVLWKQFTILKGIKD